LLKKNLTWLDGVGIGVGAMIGGGVFTVSAMAVEVAGEHAPTAFVFCALLASVIGFIYARLSVRMRSSGGSYSFVQNLLRSPPLHAAYGYLLMLAYAAAIGFYANTFASYAGQLLPLPRPLLALVPVALFTATNVAGAKESARVQNAIVALKVLVLLFFASLGFASPRLPALSFDYTVFAASAFIFITFQGFELIANSAEEMERASDLPLSIGVSIAMVTVIYVLVAWSLLSLGGAVGEAPLAEAASRVLGGAAYPIMFLGAAVATFSATNSTLFGMSRLAFAMAREGDLPVWFTELDKGLPVRSVVGSSLLSLLFMTLPLGQAALMVSATFFLVFVLVSTSSLTTGALPDWVGYLGVFVTLVPVVFGDPSHMALSLTAFLTLALLIYWLEKAGALRNF